MKKMINLMQEKQDGIPTIHHSQTEEETLAEVEMLKMSIKLFEKEKLETADRMDLFSANIDTKRLYLEEVFCRQKKRQEMLQGKIKKYKKYSLSWWLLSLLFASSLNLLISLSISSLIAFVFFCTSLFLLLAVGYAYLQRNCKEDLRKIKEEQKQMDADLIQNEKAIFDPHETGINNPFLNLKKDSAEFVEEMFRNLKPVSETKREVVPTTSTDGYNYHARQKDKKKEKEKERKKMIQKKNDRKEDASSFSTSFFWGRKGGSCSKTSSAKSTEIVDDIDNIYTGTLSIDDDVFLKSIEDCKDQLKREKEKETLIESELGDGEKDDERVGDDEKIGDGEGQGNLQQARTEEEELESKDRQWVLHRDNMTNLVSVDNQNSNKSKPVIVEIDPLQKKIQ